MSFLHNSSQTTTAAVAQTIKQESPIKNEANYNPVRKKEKQNDDIILRILKKQLSTQKTSKTKKPNKKINNIKHEDPPLNIDGTVTCERCNEILANLQEWRDHMAAQHLGRNKPLELICEHCNKGKLML